MSKKLTLIIYCNWCGDPFEVNSPNQKYCSSDLKNCSQESKRESWRKSAYKYRKNYKNILSISQVYKLGSGFLSSKAKTNFDEEYQAIQKEKKRLEINGIVAGVCIWVHFTCPFFNRNFLVRDNISFSDVYPQLIMLIILVVALHIFGTYNE